MWNVGCQLVSLNFQTPDRQMQLFRGKFKDNGSCGYLLKPSFLTDTNTSFNPRAESFPEVWGQAVTMQILSGAHLPKPEGEENSSDLVDPYVKLEVYGVKEDCAEFKTAAITDNGLNPRWGETFEFHLSVPDLAMLRINVKDYQTLTSNDMIGQCSFPAHSLQQGYRHIKLESSEGIALGPASIFVHVDMRPMSKAAWLSRRTNSSIRQRKLSGVKEMLGNSSLVVNGRSISRDSTTSDESSQGRVPSTRLVDPNEGLTLTFPTS
ncbi:PLCD3 [Bugula neritina]|uniref:Phosphoinositide phospholipase C n=1 Tax=Bugula neritina TaxID=10212 RepID=A0A7J7KLC6_BUGNE|nr:PLCD3 [Bugula neritina]